jgi:hypothetical protein
MSGQLSVSVHTLIMLVHAPCAKLCTQAFCFSKSAGSPNRDIKIVYTTDEIVW